MNFNKNKFIMEWSKKIINLYNCKDILEEVIYEEKIIQLIIELLSETSLNDTDFYNWCDSLKYYGVKDTDVFEVLKIASKELI